MTHPTVVWRLLKASVLPVNTCHSPGLQRCWEVNEITRVECMCASEGKKPDTVKILVSLPQSGSQLSSKSRVRSYKLQHKGKIKKGISSQRKQEVDTERTEELEITQSRICLVVKEIFTLLGGNDNKSQSIVHRHPEVSDAPGER